MIANHDQFEAALDAASKILETPPAEGTPAYARLVALMREISDYRPAVLVESPNVAPSETERLSRRLDAFEAQLKPHLGAHWHSMIGGDLGRG